MIHEYSTIIAMTLGHHFTNSLIRYNAICTIEVKEKPSCTTFCSTESNFMSHGKLNITKMANINIMYFNVY